MNIDASLREVLGYGLGGVAAVASFHLHIGLNGWRARRAAQALHNRVAQLEKTMEADEIQKQLEALGDLAKQAWPIVQDLARKLAALKGAEAAKKVNTLDDALAAFAEKK